MSGKFDQLLKLIEARLKRQRAALAETEAEYEQAKLANEQGSAAQMNLVPPKAK